MRAFPRRAFTLVELLVVIGIIAVLISLLLPVLQTTKRSAQQLQCATNLRTLAQALLLYSTENRGYFPPNTADEGWFWHLKTMIGRTIPSSIDLEDGSVGSRLMICPTDFEDSVRSYSINVFSSSVVSHFVTPGLEAKPPQGRLFKTGTHGSAQLILLGETWSEQLTIVRGGTSPAYVAQTVFGYWKRPGERFGAGAGMGWSVGDRFGSRASQIAWNRHRTKPRPSVFEPYGRANFAFVDGHVEPLTPEQCADMKSGKSKLFALWSLGDAEVDQAGDQGYNY